MSATELMAILEQAQQEGLGNEPLEVTPEQAERMHALLDSQRMAARAATAIPQDGRLLLVRG